MTELEKKAEEYARARNCETCYQAHLPPIYCLDVGNHCILCGHDKESFIVGYEQGISEKQLIVKIATDKNNELYEENELLKSKIKNVYEVRQKAQSEMISNLEKENEKLKAQILGLQNNIDGQKARKYHHIKENVKLNGKVEELKERLRIESQSLHEQCEIVSKQVEQIEKMKCCVHCVHYRECICTDESINLNYADLKAHKCKDWELAE